jgi:hypothetical protein
VILDARCNVYNTQGNKEKDPGSGKNMFFSALSELVKVQAQKGSTTSLSPGSKEHTWSFKDTDNKYPAGCVTVTGDASLEDAYTACAGKDSPMAPFNQITKLCIHSTVLGADISVRACDAGKRKTREFVCTETFGKRLFTVSVASGD